MVLAVGPNSEWGKTMALVQTEAVDTPLQGNLTQLAGAIGKIGLIAGVLCFVALMIRWAPCFPAVWVGLQLLQTLISLQSGGPTDLHPPSLDCVTFAPDVLNVIRHMQRAHVSSPSQRACWLVQPSRLNCNCFFIEQRSSHETLGSRFSNFVSLYGPMQ